jgi:protein-L-isoaspartate(D-aspartate) O-methyltransferase
MPLQSKALDTRKLLTSVGMPDLPLARAYLAAILRADAVPAQIVTAMEQLPRHCFLPKHRWRIAYLDLTLHTAEGWLMRPRTIARAVSTLANNARGRVLEIGAGPGYQTALLAMLFEEVISVSGRDGGAAVCERLMNTGLSGVRVVKATDALSDLVVDHGPFQCVIVNRAGTLTASALAASLLTNGQLVLPVIVGDGRQRLMHYCVEDGRIVQALDLGGCVYPS